MTRYELRMGYHLGVVEYSGPGRWTVLIASPLVTTVEQLYYDTDSAALDGCKQVLTSIQNAEDNFRTGWTRAYLTAIGRESAPDTPGPIYAGTHQDAALSSDGTVTADGDASVTTAADTSGAGTVA